MTLTAILACFGGVFGYAVMVGVSQAIAERWGFQRSGGDVAAISFLWPISLVCVFMYRLTKRELTREKSVDVDEYEHWWECNECHFRVEHNRESVRIFDEWQTVLREDCPCGNSRQSSHWSWRWRKVEEKPKLFEETA